MPAALSSALKVLMLTPRFLALRLSVERFNAALRLQIF